MPAENEKPITYWSNGFHQLYGKNDKLRTVEQIWIATTAHCSSVGESIRKFNFNELNKYSAHSFCWICSFVKKCNNIDEDNIFKLEGSLSDWVSNKYPYICGHCKASPCTCKAKDIDNRGDKAADYEILLQRKKEAGNKDYWDGKTVSNWQNHFNDIFGQKIHIQTLESIGFHFLEEAGEAAKAIRSLGQLKYFNEKIKDIDEEFINQLKKYDELLEQYKTFSREGKTKIPKPEDANFREYFISKDPEIIKSRIVHAKIDIVIEIADTFSWLCGILNKVKAIAGNIPTEIPSMEEKLIEIYLRDGKFKCPVCGEEECICTFFISEEK